MLSGRASQGPCRSGTTPRCAGRKIWIENASMLSSGLGMPAMPMKVSFLMSASEAFSSADTRASSASFTLSMVPSRVLHMNVSPSTFSICPRIRPGCCAWAAVAKSRTIAAAPSARRVIFNLYILIPPDPAPAQQPVSIRRITPPCRAYSARRKLSLLLEQIGFDQGAQLRRYLRAYAEPKLESPNRLMQQHAEAVRRS